jgi:hypothetical protein
VVERILFAQRGRRADPHVGKREEVGAAAVPRAGGRNAHEVDPDRDAGPPDVGSKRVHDLGLPPRTGRQEFPQPGGGTRHRPWLRLLDAPQPRDPVAADGEDERPVVARRRQVDRVPHQRRLDHASPFERTRERVALEALEP